MCSRRLRRSSAKRRLGTTISVMCGLRASGESGRVASGTTQIRRLSRIGLLLALPSGGALGFSGLRENPEGIVEAAQKIESEYIPERRNSVFHPDLLPLLVGTAVVGDWHLVNGNSEFGHLRRYFNLESESAASNRHVADDLATECLIA